MNTQQQANILIQMICDEYKITKLDLKKKRSAYTKKYNQKHYVSISSIRQSLSYFIYIHFPLTITQVAKMVGYSDHSPLSCQRKQIEHYIKTKDLYFFPYYEKVKEYAYLLGISTEYKRMIIQENPFVRYESDVDFISNIKYYKNVKTIC
jgi:hypothetical protein